MAFYPKRAALRLVNSSGITTMGPLRLWLPESSTYGLIAHPPRVEYVPELLGPYTNTAYQERWTLLGYRLSVEIDFRAIVADGASGFANLLTYYHAGLASETYAALQFNAYYDTSPTWRGVYPTSQWAPEPLLGKDRTGYQYKLVLRGRDLVTNPGDWSTGAW